MPGYVALVDLISADVVSGLAKGGWPALRRGKILLGREFQFQNGAPPQILFVPVGNSFSGKSVYDASSASSLPGYNANQKRQRALPSIQTDVKKFEVRCWGLSPDKDPAASYDFTEALYQQVIRSIHATCTGSYVIGDGEWTDGKIEESQLIRYGREVVFSVEINTPVSRFPVPFQYAPADVQAENTVKIDVAGTVEIGAVFKG